jgi:hypothetical protein
MKTNAAAMKASAPEAPIPFHYLGHEPYNGLYYPEVIKHAHQGRYEYDGGKYLEGDDRPDGRVRYEASEEEPGAYLCKIKEPCHDDPCGVEHELARIGLEYNNGEDELETHAPADEPQVNPPAVLAHRPGDAQEKKEPNEAYEFLSDHEKPLLFELLKKDNT